MMRPRLPSPRDLLLAAALLVSSCATLKFERETQTSGTFVSKAWSMTIISYDVPKDALAIARENASDAGLANMQVQDVRFAPYLGWFDWIFNIIGIRVARIRGTWGFSPTETASEVGEAAVD